jgi:hypothetical protein
MALLRTSFAATMQRAAPTADQSGSRRRSEMAEMKTHAGSCHCGKVRYEATTDLAQVIACNCSICAKHGLWLTFVKPEQFKVLAGESELKDYQFNKHIIHHLFCPACGVEPFARGKTKDGDDMIAVNVRCLDGVDIAALSPKPFDGRSL